MKKYFLLYPALFFICCFFSDKANAQDEMLSEVIVYCYLPPPPPPSISQLYPPPEPPAPYYPPDPYYYNNYAYYVPSAPTTTVTQTTTTTNTTTTPTPLSFEQLVAKLRIILGPKYVVEIKPNQTVAVYDISVTPTKFLGFWNKEIIDDIVAKSEAAPTTTSTTTATSNGTTTTSTVTTTVTTNAWPSDFLTTFQMRSFIDDPFFDLNNDMNYYLNNYTYYVYTTTSTNPYPNGAPPMIYGNATSAMIDEICTRISATQAQRDWLVSNTRRAYDLHYYLFNSTGTASFLDEKKQISRDFITLASTNLNFRNYLAPIAPYMPTVSSVPFWIYFREIMFYGNRIMSSEAFLNAAVAHNVSRDYKPRIGRIFEFNALKSLGYPNLPADKENIYPDPNSNEYFIPDYKENQIYQGTPPGNPPFHNYDIPNSVLTDVKFTSTGKVVLEPYYNPEQITGFIDYLASPDRMVIKDGVRTAHKASDYGIAKLVIITPFDVKIDQSIINYAKQMNVTIVQRVAIQVTTFSSNYSGSNTEETAIANNIIKISEEFTVFQAANKVNDPDFDQVFVYFTTGDGKGNSVPIDWSPR